MRNRDYQYTEKQLQMRFVAWLAQERGYIEMFSDASSTDTDLDSVGMMGERAVLIEVKDRLSPGQVYSQPNKRGSIERKIASGLRTLHLDSDNILTSGIQHRNKALQPIIILTAGKMSPEAERRARDLLERRGEEWQFGWHLYRMDDQPRLLASADAGPQYSSPMTPVITESGPPRQPPPDAAEFADLFQARGVVELYLSLTRLVEKSGGRFRKMNQRSATFEFRTPKGKWVALVSVYLDSSSASHGLCLGFELERLSEHFSSALVHEDALPGIEAARIGYRNVNRQFVKAEEIEAAWQLLTGQTQPG